MSRVTSFVSAALAMLVASRALCAQTVAAPDGFAEGLATRVAESIAEVWRVSPDRLRLEWGRITLQHELPADVPFRLVGRGTDGWFAVAFTPSQRSTVAVRVRAGIEDTVVVATRPLAAGTQLSPGDFERTVRVRWRPPRAKPETLPDIGWQIRRPVAAGVELSSPAVSRPFVIDAGEPVRFTWSRGTVHVSVFGIALNAARTGDQVRARVEGRSGHVTGIATATGMAKLTGGSR